MRGFIIISIVVFNWKSVTIAVENPATTPTPTTPPPLTFECDSNGMVSKIEGSAKDKLLWDNNGNYCYIINSLTCDWKNHKTLRIFYDENEGNPNIIAARTPHFYQIDCNNQFDVNITAKIISVSVSTQSPIKKTLPPPSLKLEILKGDAALTGGVIVGEKLKLEIRSQGGYRADPKQCSAYHDIDQEKFTLWEGCKSKDNAIMDDAWTLIDNKTSIPFYAFKFVSSDTVTIECAAHVYPTGIHYQSSCTNNTQRRRRSANIESRPLSNMKVESATASFIIQRVASDSNNSAGLSMSFMLHMSAASAAFAMMRLVHVI